jgi:hypothetical protein
VPPVVVRIRKGPKQSNQSLARSVVTISHLARALDGKLDNKNDRAPCSIKASRSVAEQQMDDSGLKDMLAEDAVHEFSIDKLTKCSWWDKIEPSACSLGYQKLGDYTAFPSSPGSFGRRTDFFEQVAGTIKEQVTAFGSDDAVLVSDPEGGAHLAAAAESGTHPWSVRHIINMTDVFHVSMGRRRRCRRRCACGPAVLTLKLPVLRADPEAPARGLVLLGSHHGAHHWAAVLALGRGQVQGPGQDGAGGGQGGGQEL